MLRPEDIRAFYGDVLRASLGRNFSKWANMASLSL